MTGPVELRHEDGVAVLTLARPDVRNACSGALLDGVHGVLAGPDLDGASALVFTGAGTSFCSGGDIAVMRGALTGDTDFVMGSMIAVLQDIVARLRTLPIPVVAAVEGPAVGAGMGLALAADLRVVATSAVLIPGYMALAASPDAGVSYFLTRALGGPRALSAFLLNTPLRAETLLEFGLAEEIVADGGALGAGLALAKRVSGTAPDSLLAVRRLIDQAPTHDLASHLAAEVREFRGLWKGDDFREGVTAFLERRPPRFTGRAGSGTDPEVIPG